MRTNTDKIAAIDIGSNAMRVAFATFDENKSLKVFKNYRYPIRLGADVFKCGIISKKRIRKTEEAFSEILHKLAKYNITKVHAVATSALRDSKNGKELRESIFNLTGINIETISGDKEAELIKKAIGVIIPFEKKVSLLIDIGGGSTEIIIIKNGVISFVKSYQLGTVRFLNDSPVKIRKTITQMQQDITNTLQGEKVDQFIGTGGNLRRMGKLRGLFFNKPMNQITKVELNKVYSNIKVMNIEQRVKELDMRKDRADVIIPAISIVKSLMATQNIESILLPRVGLKEGVLIDNLPYPPLEVHLPIKGQ